jgi:hypothetical protein
MELDDIVVKKPTIKELMAEEFTRCGLDSKYFIKKYCTIVHPQRGKILFETYPYQDDLLDIFESKHRTIILKGRQLGISTLSAGFILWRMIFNDDYNVVIVATKQKVAKNLVKKVKIMNDLLPSWMRSECIENNMLSVVLSNGSRIIAETTAEDVGRSEAASLVVIDECAHIKRMSDIWTALQPTLSTGGDCIALSSPNGYGNWFHKTWCDAEEGRNSFQTVELPWSVHPERTQKWRDEQEIELGPRRAAQECDAKFLSSGNTVIAPDILEWYQNNTVKQPIRKITPTVSYSSDLKDTIWIWKDPDFDAKYIISGDVARGDGDDYSTFHIIDTKTYEQVAEFEGKLPPNNFGDLILEYAVKYNDAYVIVENANIGMGTCQRLIDRGCRNLHYTKESDKRGFVNEKTKFSSAIKKSDVPGFTMSLATRPLVISQMEEIIRLKQIIINSQRTITQLRTFVYLNNKPQAAYGYNDDIVMALCIAIFGRDVALINISRNDSMVTAMLGAIHVSRSEQNTHGNIITNPWQYGTGRQAINLTEFL